MVEYKVIYERDIDGWWVARIPKIRGCHTQGRTIDQARERIREALGLYIKGANKVRLVDEIRLPKTAQNLVRKVAQTRVRAEREQKQLQECTSAAAKILTQTMHIGVRDAGQLLGLSHQRVQQIVRKSAVRRRAK
jgi:predicted RNase H-like HicB family nuclease